MDLFTKAKELGIQTEFIDGQGHRHVTDAAALKIILDALPVRLPHRFLDGAVVVRSGRPARTELSRLPRSRCAGKSLPVLRLSREGETARSQHRLAGGFACRLLSAATDRCLLLDARRCRSSSRRTKAFGGDFDRCWLLAVQLYGVRSARNWGIGDFTDLEGLIELAGRSGRRAASASIRCMPCSTTGRRDCSPYSPNSRLFLNPLYIDVEKLAEFLPGAIASERRDRPAASRAISSIMSGSPS